MKRRHALTLLSLGVATWVTGCGGGSSDSSTTTDGSSVTGSGTTDATLVNGPTDLVMLAQSDPNLSILVEAVIAADMVATLKGSGPFTVFAPVNAAFAALLGELGLTKAQLLADKALLNQVLTYHVLAGKVERAQIPGGKAITTVQGGIFKIDTAGGTATITDGRNRTAGILVADRQASNGVMHTIDRVLLPANKTLLQTAQALPQFSILVEAVMAANLQDALSATGPLTVFAPTNDAFTQLLAQINFTKEALLSSGPLLADMLKYHVVPGRVLKADVPVDSPITTLEGSSFTIASDLTITDQLLRSSRITATDVLASNGVIHVVDQVLLHRVILA
ncbi:MAG: hypothetical protein RIS90_2825 [Pseudomonadota bacterium]|jgi:uncharacterized surface protein with fasciclin (FAS1) repeats